MMSSPIKLTIQERLTVYRFLISISGLILLMLLSGCLFFSRPVTRAQASRLHAGMTYQNVVRVLGSKGEMEPIPDSQSQWKSDADGNKITVTYRKEQVFNSGLHHDGDMKEMKSTALYQRYSRLKIGMSRSEVEKILGTPRVTVPIQTDAEIFRWEMKPEGNTLIVKFKGGRLFNTHIDQWTPPSSSK